MNFQIILALILLPTICSLFLIFSKSNDQSNSTIKYVAFFTSITPLCIISVNNSVKKRLRDFLIAILIMESFMIGVFCSLDLIIFYLFFEAGLIPMFLIIGIWGGPKRVYSAFKFFLYTLLGSVLMLVAIISIY